MTILVVDDEPLVLQVVTHTLHARGYTVLEARSGAEAVQIAATHDGEIDLLVFDHSLKDTTGRAVAERILNSRPGMKMLQYSGYLRKQLSEAGALAPGAEFIQKPFRPAALVEKVQQVLTGGGTDHVPAPAD